MNGPVEQHGEYKFSNNFSNLLHQSGVSPSVCLSVRLSPNVNAAHIGRLLEVTRQGQHGTRPAYVSVLLPTTDILDRYAFVTAIRDCRRIVKYDDMVLRTNMDYVSNKDRTINKTREAATEA